MACFCRSSVLLRVENLTLTQVRFHMRGEGESVHNIKFLDWLLEDNFSLLNHEEGIRNLLIDLS